MNEIPLPPSIDQHLSQRIVESSELLHTIKTINHRSFSLCTEHASSMQMPTSLRKSIAFAVKSARTIKQARPLRDTICPHSTETKCLSLINRVIWQIETKRQTPLTLAALSDLCAVSPFHLSRAFRSGTGLSPMAYLRARRLTIAAHQLAQGSPDILTIALDAQYSSHEAFSRAFVTEFGVQPSVIRSQRSTQTLTLTEPLTMTQSEFVPVDPPRFDDCDAFQVSGLAIDCPNFDTREIPGLWQDLSARATFAPGTYPKAAYGVCFDGTADGFRYLAGYKDSDPGLADAKTIDLPKSRYAVFTHSGHIADLPKFVYSIWNQALEAHALTPAKAPEFELYDERFDVQTGRGTVEIWIPIE